MVCRGRETQEKVRELIEAAFKVMRVMRLETGCHDPRRAMDDFVTVKHRWKVVRNFMEIGAKR
jgi:hypothetical protein